MLTHVGTVAQKVALRQVFLKYLGFPPMLHTQMSLIHHRRYTKL